METLQKALRMDYHLTHTAPDTLSPIIREFLDDAFILINQLLKELTKPPFIQIPRVHSPSLRSKFLTTVWDLIGPIPVLSTEAIEAHINVDTDSKLREALFLLISLINEFHTVLKAYYQKKTEDMVKYANLDFSTKFRLLHLHFNLKIRLALAHTTTHTVQFIRIASLLQLIADKVGDDLNPAKLLQEGLVTRKTEVLPFTHEEVKKQYHESLFSWAKDLKPEYLEHCILEIINNKYSPVVPLLSSRQRADSVKEYLMQSTNEHGDNRLAYILSSGSKLSGELNIQLIKGLTPLMLSTHPIPSITMAIKDKSFDKGINQFTQDVVIFAQKDPRFSHAFTYNYIKTVYKVLYDWVDTLTEHSFTSLINSSIKQYEHSSWALLETRRTETESYFVGNNNSKVLELIFENGTNNSLLSEIIFNKILKCMKKEASEGILFRTECTIINQIDFKFFRTHRIPLKSEFKEQQEPPFKEDLNNSTEDPYSLAWVD